MSNGTTVLFGLRGVRVARVDEVGFGGAVVHVETAYESMAGCPSCGVVPTSVKEYVITTPRDIPYGERRIWLVWHKRRWRCVEPMCAESVIHGGDLRRCSSVGIGHGLR